MSDTSMSELVKAIINAAYWCKSHNIDYPYKTRDRREPGRIRKMEAELRVSSILMRMFRNQAKKIRRQLEVMYANRKALTAADFIELADDKELAELIAEIMIATRDGISLFDEDINLTLDYTTTNTEAAEWARKYGYDLVKKIDDQTRAALQQAVSAFVETPGMTIGQVMDMLPFDEERALRVAVTEITRAYGRGQQMAGEALAAEFPDVKVVKKWFTNQDDKVCELCGPLGNGDWIPIDDPFYEPEDDYQDGNPPRHVNCRCWIQTSTEIAE